MLARLCCVGSFRRPRMATCKLSRKRLMSEKVTDLPDEELRELPDADAQVGSIMWEKRKLEMEWRIADRQLEMSRDLVKFSKRLVIATWVLVFTALALVATGVGQLLQWLKTEAVSAPTPELTDARRHQNHRASSLPLSGDVPAKNC